MTLRINEVFLVIAGQELILSGLEPDAFDAIANDNAHKDEVGVPVFHRRGSDPVQVWPTPSEGLTVQVRSFTPGQNGERT